VKHTPLGDGLVVPGAMGMSAFYGSTDEAEAVATRFSCSPPPRHQTVRHAASLNKPWALPSDPTTVVLRPKR
jgi:hypothetical protein